MGSERMNQKQKTRLKIMLAIGVLMIAAILCLCRTDDTIKTTVYSVETPLEESIRIVHLTDLHGKVFGNDNDELVELVSGQMPDLIVMTGDMMDRSHDNADVACRLITRLTEIAPVYWCYGNHEYEWMQSRGQSLTAALAEAGAVVLDTAYLDLTINDQPVRIGGYEGYYRQPHMLTEDPEQKAAELEFAADFEDTWRYKILLNHIPTTWVDWEYINNQPVDLVLAGHYHGGQIVLPLVGGVYAPYVGWFPAHTRGLFEGTEGTCVLSGGLGSSPGIPRINNPPEIVVVELVPEQA